MSDYPLKCSFDLEKKALWNGSPEFTTISFHKKDFEEFKKKVADWDYYYNYAP